MNDIKAEKQDSIKGILLRLSIVAINISFFTSLYIFPNVIGQILLCWFLYSIFYLIYGIITHKNMFSILFTTHPNKKVSVLSLFFDQILPIFFFTFLISVMIIDSIAIYTGRITYSEIISPERQLELANWDKATFFYFTIISITYFGMRIVNISKKTYSIW